MIGKIFNAGICYTYANGYGYFVFDGLMMLRFRSGKMFGK